MVAAVGDLRFRAFIGRPEDAAADVLEAGRGQHVIQAHGAGLRAEIAGGVERRALAHDALGRIGQAGLLATDAARGGVAQHARVLDQVDDGVVAAVAVHRVVVQIAEDHEARVLGQAAAVALVIAQPRLVASRQVFLPQAQFVVVARGIALFRAIEHRRRRVRDQRVDHAARGLHRHVPMRLRGQAQLRPHLVVVEALAGARVDRTDRAGHRAPLQQLEAAHLGFVDRVARQHQHAVLARVQAVAPGVVAAAAAFAADRAVAVQVQAAGHAGVDRGQVAVGEVQRLAAAGLGHFQVALLEQVGGAVGVVEVELVQQHQVGAHLLQHRGDLARVLAVAFQFLDQAAGIIRIQRGVVGGQAQRRGRLFGHRRGLGEGGGAGAAEQGQGEDQGMAAGDVHGPYCAPGPVSAVCQRPSRSLSKSCQRRPS